MKLSLLADAFGVWNILLFRIHKQAAPGRHHIYQHIHPHPVLPRSRCEGTICSSVLDLSHYMRMRAGWQDILPRHTAEHSSQQLPWALTLVYVRQKKLLATHSPSHTNRICGGRSRRRDACSITQNPCYREKDSEQLGTWPQSVPADGASTQGRVSAGSPVC